MKQLTDEIQFWGLMGICAGIVVYIVLSFFIHPTEIEGGFGAIGCTVTGQVLGGASFLWHNRR